MPHKDPVVRKAYKKVYNAEYMPGYREENKKKLKRDWRSYYERNRDALIARQREKYWEKLDAYLFYAAKDRASKLGIEFNLEKEDLKIPAMCPVFNVPFIKGDKNLTPSVDRIDSSKGYVKGNVSIISFRANRLKNNATLTELENLVSYLKKAREQEERTPPAL